MSYYNVCTECGSNLDPGERCDCKKEKERKQKKEKQQEESGRKTA